MRFKIKDNLTNQYFGTILNFVDKIMNTITYGMFDENGEEISDPNEWYDKTRVQSPEWVIEHRRGNCVDQVNLEYWFFKENGILTTIYYIEYDNQKGERPSHMFIVLENNGKFYWYENAWKEYAGLHEYYSLNECLTDIKNKYCPLDFIDSCKIYKIKKIDEGSNPNQVLNQKIINIKDIPRLYYISEKELNDEILEPTIPNNMLTQFGYADTKQERIPFYPSIEQALSDNPNVKSGKKYYVYIPNGDFDYYRPNISEIPQVLLTGETWIKSPIKLKKIGNFKVVKEVPDEELTFTYGEDYEGQLKKWQYSILNGNLTKDSWSEIEEKKILRERYLKKHPLTSPQKLYMVVESMYKKNHQKKEPISTKQYYVINDLLKIVFTGTDVACKRYIDTHKNEWPLEMVLKEAYEKMPSSELKELFEPDIGDGLIIEFGPNKEFNCLEVNVRQGTEIIDQELCEEEDLKYVIDNFKKEYKITKTIKRS